MTIFSLVLTHRISQAEGGKHAEEAAQEKWIILPLFSLVMVMAGLDDTQYAPCNQSDTRE
jgi:hypothetical protein